MDKEAIKKQIDGMSYAELLKKWRFCPAGHPWFCDEEIYTHFRNVMEKKKQEIGAAAAVAVSKGIGW